MAGQDPYKVLNVSSSASADEIRTAYRKLAKKYHPDLNPGNKEAERKFKEVNAANEIIGDPEKRAKFDRGEIDATGTATQAEGFHEQTHQAGSRPFYYQTQQDGGRYTANFEGLDDNFFEHLFGARAKEMERQSVDEHYLLQVDFKSALLGDEKDMTLPTGKTVKVKIPPGIDSGQKLRLKGLAEGKTKEGVAGDVYIEIRVEPSKLFTRSGKDIELDVPVTFYEAIAGGEIEVPTLEKSIRVKVPSGSNTGTRLKIKGKGAGAIKESDRGDLFLRLKVMMPPKVDQDLIDLVKNIGSSHPYNPRENLLREGGI